MAGGRAAIDEAGRETTEPSEVDASGLVLSGASDRLRLTRGELTAEAYLELQVERALLPYRGLLAEPLLEAMRDVLRAQLDADPALAELAARATQIES